MKSLFNHLIILVACLASVSCTNKLNRDIIGRWYVVQDDPVLFEFFRDGDFLAKYGTNQYSGKWSVISENRVKAEFTGLGTTTMLLFDDINISGELMTLKLNDNKCELTRTLQSKSNADQNNIDAARIEIAKYDVNQIATGLIGYEIEYGKLPTTDSGEQTVSGDLLNTLLGNNTAMNPRAISFSVEKKEKKPRNSGINRGVFYDPWNQPYRILIDNDSDNNIIGAPGVSGGLRKKVAVWSIGRPQTGDSAEDPTYKPNTDSKYFIKSWE